jgi:hypothetical protein
MGLGGSVEALTAQVGLSLSSAINGYHEYPSIR